MEYRVIRSDDHLAHYGVKGMKWGVRKSYVTKTGSLQRINRKKGLAGINTIPYTRMASRYSQKAFINERKAKTAKTKLGRNYRTAKGKNLRANADMYKKWAENGTNVLDRFDDALNQKYTSITGREYTAGKEFVGNMLTSGLYGTAKEIQYLHNKNKS